MFVCMHYSISRQDLLAGNWVGFWFQSMHFGVRYFQSLVLSKPKNCHVVSLCMNSISIFRVPSGCSQGDCGEPLMISPLLETGAIEEARRLAAVDGLTVTSYAGFITVSPVKSLYFWYFPKLSEVRLTPVLPGLRQPSNRIHMC